MLNLNSFNRRLKAEKELENLLQEEEDYWKIRSREYWLKGGDKNTKWFHSRASHRKRKNEINGIFNEQNQWVESEVEIGRVATNYFKSLLSTNNPSQNDINEVASAIISETQRAMLDHPFSKEENKIAIKGMNATKAPRSDGAHALFYQHYWDLVGEDTTRVCLGILNEGEEMEPINKTLITLIPKIKDPKRMRDFRPISLCNVIYKIVSKFISNRLKKVFDSLISHSQSAFITGRQISDNVLVGFECIHALNNRRKGRDGFVAGKLDMSKAYDRVEWNYIQEIMKKMGFSEAWTKKVMSCITSVSYSIILNGSHQEVFKPSRGLRQGDPLSPYLFLLCAEGFSALLNKEESNSNLSGFKINNHCPPLTHIFFADDSLVFFKAKEKDLITFKQVLEAYEKASGQTINLDKSAFMTSKNTRMEDSRACERILDIKRTESLGVYLGMPSQNGRNKGAIFKTEWKKCCKGGKKNYSL